MIPSVWLRIVSYGRKIMYMIPCVWRLFVSYRREDIVHDTLCLVVVCVLS